MQPFDVAQFSHAKDQVATCMSSDHAFDLIYHLCDALHNQGLVATSRVLEDALDTYLAEARRIRPDPIIEGSTCPPEAGTRLRAAIARMHSIEDTYRP